MLENTPPASPSPGFWRYLPWIAVVLLAVAVAWGAHNMVVPGITGWVNDDGCYVDFAQALLHGHGFVSTFAAKAQPAYRYPIMFPALLAFVSLGAHGITAELMRMQWVGPVSAGLFAILVFVYMRRVAAWPNWGALAAAVLVGCHPNVTVSASMILSDVPTAALGMVAMLALERVLRRETPAPLRFALCGVLLVALCLMRYAAATLIVAAALVLLKDRRWKDLLGLLGGFAIALVPWLVYRARTGGEEYHTTLTFLAEKSPVFLFKNFSAIAATLLSKSLPSFVFPNWPTLHTIPLLMGGAAVTAIMGLGALAAINRPTPGQSALGPLYFIVSVGMILVWMVRYVTTASFATDRLLMPIAPFAILAFVRGLQEIRSRYEAIEKLPIAQMMALSTLALVAFTGLHYAQYVTDEGLIAQKVAQGLYYQETFDYIRKNLPPKAVLLSLMSPAVYLHTGHHCLGTDYSINDAQLIGMLAAHHVDYYVGLPVYLEPPPWLPDAHGMFDASVVIVNDLVKHHPGLLKPVYFNNGGRLGIFKIDKPALALALKQLAR